MPVRHIDKHPIELSVAGDGRVVQLTPWTIRNFMQLLATSNPGFKQLSSLFSFDWMIAPETKCSAWQKLKYRIDLSKTEIATIERQANYFLVRDRLFLTPRPKEILVGFVPSNGPQGSRRVKYLSFNGLALELRTISNSELLTRNADTIVVTANTNYGSFNLQRFHGARTTGKLSQRKLSCVFSSFYDRTVQYEMPLSEFNHRRWHEVVELAALDGFTLVGPQLNRRSLRDRFTGGEFGSRRRYT